MPPGLTDVTAVAAGYRHSLALKRDGTIVAWGDDQYGQTTVPTDVHHGVAISAGARYTLALYDTPKR